MLVRVRAYDKVVWRVGVSRRERVYNVHIEPWRVEDVTISQCKILLCFVKEQGTCH